MARPYDAAAAMGGLSLKEGEGVSSKAARFPVRPGLGKAGRKCILFANHFFAKFKPDLELYHYDVSALSPVRVPSISAWSFMICSASTCKQWLGYWLDSSVVHEAVLSGA
jgi:hypothetical protein